MMIARGWRKRRRITMLEYPEQKRTVLTTPVEQPKKREWVGLDADEVFELASGRWTLGQMAVLVEAKLKEKNT